METKRMTACLAAAVLCLGAFLAGQCRAEEPAALNVSLYPYVPDYEAFKRTAAALWGEKHPETALNFVDWDCYGGSVPDDLDVFVFDTLSLDAFAGKGFLLPLPEEAIGDRADLIPCFMEGCRVDGGILAVPQLLCTDLLFTRGEDEDLKDVQSIDGLYAALDDFGLVMDRGGGTMRVSRYLQAMIDGEQRYMDTFPPIGEATLYPEAVESLAKTEAMRIAIPDGVMEDGETYGFARIFAEGLGRAYIGYAESMSAMGERAHDMDFRLFSMTDGGNIPVFYVDAAAVNAKIGDEKKALALELLDMITGRELLTRVSVNGGSPLYLLVPRYSVYDALAADHPIYAELKKIATVPDAHVFRIKPDGSAYVAEARANLALLLEGAN